MPALTRTQRLRCSRRLLGARQIPASFGDSRQSFGCRGRRARPRRASAVAGPFSDAGEDGFDARASLQPRRAVIGPTELVADRRQLALERLQTLAKPVDLSVLHIGLATHGGGTLFWYVTNHPGRLSLLPSVGR